MGWRRVGVFRPIFRSFFLLLRALDFAPSQRRRRFDVIFSGVAVSAVARLLRYRWITVALSFSGNLLTIWLLLFFLRARKVPFGWARPMPSRANDPDTFSFLFCWFVMETVSVLAFLSILRFRWFSLCLSLSVKHPSLVVAGFSFASAAQKRNAGRRLGPPSKIKSTQLDVRNA